MKFVVLTNSSLGLYLFRSEVIEMLSHKGDVFLCMPGNDEILQHWQDMGCKCIDCNLLDRRGTNPIKDLLLILFYRRIIKTIRPDLVLTYTIKPNIYGGLVCGFSKIKHIANITGLGTSIENESITSKLPLFLYRLGLKKTAYVFFQNLANQKFFFNQGIVRTISHVIPGSGVNLESNKLESYPDETEGIRFLFVGRIMKHKGVDELLEAIEIIRSEKNNVSLDIVGGQDENYSNVLVEAETKGLIRYHGVQSNVHLFYKNCHCTVLPSYHEGMANVMLEASSTGRPVITTRVPGCKETFDEGITGFGCEAKNTESLVSAMRKFLSLSKEQRMTMGLAARRKMEKEFDRKIVVRAYEEAIDKLLSNDKMENNYEGVRKCL